MKKIFLLLLLISTSIQAQVIRKGSQIIGGANTDSQTITISGNDLQITNGASIKVNPKKFVPNSVGELTASLAAEAGKTIEIREPYDLGGGTVTLPENTTLTFVGNGMISNGTITGPRWTVEAGVYQIFDTDVTLSGIVFDAFYAEWYGGFPNDGIDDGDAIYSAMINACEIDMQEGVYNITGTRDVSKTEPIMIRGNGAILKLDNSDLDGAFDFQSNISLLTVENLIIDGDLKASTGFRIRSDFVFNDVEVKDFVNNTSSVAGFRVEVDKQLKRAQFNNCNGSNFDGGEDAIIGNSIGAARAIVVNYTYVTEPTRVEVNGGRWVEAWGDDGDVFQIAGTSNTYDHDCKFIIRDAFVADGSRRLVKGTTSGFEAYNTYFKSADVSNPKVATTTSAGMLTFSIFNDPLTPNERNQGGRFIDCTFDNTGGYDGRVIATKAENIEVKGSTFIGDAAFILNGFVGNIEFSGNNMSGGDVHTNASCQFEGKVVIKNNNYKQVTGSPYRALVEINDSGANIDNLEIINNTIETVENPGDTFFGVAYFASGATYGKIEILKNDVLRDGPNQRNELLRIDGDVTDQLVILNNYLRSTSYVSANAIDLNGTNATNPLIKGNLHRSGDLMGETASADPVDLPIQLDSNAATTDENITGSWTTNPDVTLSTTTDSYHGSNAILLEKTAGTVEFNTFSFPAIVGKTYKVQYSAKVNVQNAQRALSWQGTSTTVNQSFQLTYTEYEEVFDATAANIEMRFYVSASGDGNNGDQLFVDYIKVFEVN